MTHRRLLDKTGSLWTAVCAAFATLALHFLRFGYNYGASDQDETLSLVLHRLDPSLFASDWFVQTQSGELGVRSAFTFMLSGLSTAVPVWLAFLLVHIISFLLVAVAVYQLARLLVQSELAAMATMVTALVLTPQWTLGGDDLVNSLLVPTMVAWAAGLWGLFFHLKHRHVAAGLLLGVATALQALVGMHLAALVAAHLLTNVWRGKARVRAAAATFLPYLLPALPILIFLALGQTRTAEAEQAYPSLFYIVAAFRNPHHYLPLSFPIQAYVKFGLLLVAGSLGLYWLHRKSTLRHTEFLGAGGYVLAIFVVLGFALTEIVPVLPVANFQPFKLTVFAKIVLLAGIFGAGMRLFPPMTHLEEALRTRPAVTYLGLVAVAVLALFAAGASSESLKGRIHSIAHAESALGVTEEWARTATSREAVFLVPPSITTFRTNARRSIVVNFKSFPFQPDLSRSWFRRLLSIAPIELPQRSDRQTLRRLDAAYTAQSPARLARLMERFDVDYVLIERALTTSDVLREVFNVGTWHVYAPASLPGPHLTSAEVRSDVVW